MFEFVRTHTRLFLFVLVLLIIPSFVFFGIQGYNRVGDPQNEPVAEVGGRPITQAEWDASHRDQVERARRQMPGIDVKLLDTPEMRRQTLEALVRDRVMLAAAVDLNIVTTDDRLQRLFAADPQFAQLRNPDGSVNRDFLAAQGMSSEMFAQRLRQDLTLRQVMQGVNGTVLATPAVASAALDSFFQQREVQVQRFDTKDYLAKVSPTDAEVEAYYKDPANAAQFQAPESAEIEYVVLDAETLKKDIKVPQDDLRKYYDENISRYSTPEERRARHILFKAERSAPADARAQAKAEAEQVLAELQKNPGAFAELAKKHSDDPGSAERGGDLDFFGRGAMTGPFDDAVFSLKKGELSGIVETDFGFHIVEVTDARGGEKKSFEQVQTEIEDQVRQELAQKKFSELAVDFGNTVYEQSDTLKPAAEKFSLEIKRAQDVRQVPGPQASGPLASAKFLEALFSQDVIRNKRNTDAVETAPNQLVSGRIVRHTPAHTLPLAEVKDRVREAVAQQQAAALARKEGEARLADLKKDAKAEMPGESVVISRATGNDLPRPVVDAALRADPASLPTPTGADLGAEGYAVVRVNKVLGRDPVAADADRAQAQYAQAWADAETIAYYEALKSRLKVEIHAPSPAAATDAPRSGSN